MRPETRTPDSKAKVVAEDEPRFAEEAATLLSDRDRNRLLDLLANPPAPPPALERAGARHKARRSR